MQNYSPKLKIGTAKKVFVFIDTSNIIYGAGKEGWQVDFAKLSKYLRERYSAQKIFYYAGLDQDNKKQLKFYEKLQEFGYLLRLVPVKRFVDGSKKADVDSRMTFELMKYFSEYQEAIVMTGDGDFYWVLEYLIQKGKKLRIISERKSAAAELRKLVGGDFISLKSLRNIIERKKNATDSTNESAARDYAKSLANKNGDVKGKKLKIQN